MSGWRTRLVAADGWVATVGMPTARSGFAVVSTSSGLLIALGGTTTTIAGTLLAASTAQLYDPATQTWSALPPLPTPRYFLGAALLDGILYAPGGVRADGSGVTNVVEAYDLAQGLSGQWTTLPPLPVAQETLGVVAAACGKVFVVGGFLGNYPTGRPLDTVYAYAPAARQWDPYPPLPVARETAAVVECYGKLLTFGGYTGRQCLVDVAELDPLARTWTAKAPMPAPRAGHGAAVSGDRVYVMAGFSNGAFLRTVDSYEPLANTWRAELALPVARHLTQAGASGMRLFNLGGIAPNGGGAQATAYQYERAA
jgi:N-acetylneuraminic acid mutarotase